MRYACRRGQLDQGEPKCIAFGGIPVDEAIGHEILRVVQPQAVEAAVLASQTLAHQHDDVKAALRRDLEAARYEARRAQKQFDAVDPENRLVTDELERRWNQALQRVSELESRLDAQAANVVPVAPATLLEFQNLAADLEAIWNGSGADLRLKKRIVRTLIHEVMVDVDSAGGEVILVIHWCGGVHTELRLPRRRRGSCSATSKDIVTATCSLARICDDTAIAGILNRNGLRTGRGNRWTRGRVTSLRCTNSIPVYATTEDGALPNWLTLTDAAASLGVSSRTLRLAVEQGRIEGEHPLPEGPWIFSRSALQTEAAAQVVKQARSRRADPAGPDSEDDNGGLFSK